MDVNYVFKCVYQTIFIQGVEIFHAFSTIRNVVDKKLVVKSGSSEDIISVLVPFW